MYSRFITCKVKLNFCFALILMIKTYLVKVKNPVCQNIRIFPKINPKKYLQNKKVQVL